MLILHLLFFSRKSSHAAGTAGQPKLRGQSAGVRMKSEDNIESGFSEEKFLVLKAI